MTGKLGDTACIYAWDYPVINFSRKELRYCCRSAPQRLSDADIAQGPDLFDSHRAVTDLRRDLLNGIKNSRCSSCWDIEAAGGQGPRTRIDAFVNFLKTNNVWPGLNWDQIAQKLEQLSQQDVEELINLRFPKKIEISLGNTCDLKCVYCNHHYSSQWAAELLQHDEIKAHEIEQELPRSKDTAYEDIWWAWFEQHAGKHTETVNFIGGEPLIIDKFYAYCNRIIDFYGCNPGIGHKELTVVTNFNTPERFLDRFLEICSR